MSPFERVIFLVSADPALTRQFVTELLAAGEHYQLPIAASVAQARKGFRHVAPSAILLDESAMSEEKTGEAKPGSALELAAAMLTESAPVVVLAAPERQAELAYLITSGAIDFVARVGNFLPVAVGLLVRRVRMAEQAEAAEIAVRRDPDGDFGEILRHEVNNPLTGILGNAELLLARRDRLPPAAVQRLQTIAELAVRLRETVRRLSNAWEGRHDHARSA